MKKLLTPLLIFVAFLGGALTARQLDAQVTWSPSSGYSLRGTADPTAGAGIVAFEGTVYVRIGATDQLWVKTGPANTAWTNVPIAGGSGSFSSLTVTGDVSAASVTAPIFGTATADDPVFRRNSTEMLRLTANGPEIRGAAPLLSFRETDQGVDGKIYWFSVAAGEWRLDAVNDAETIATRVLTVNRTAMTVNYLRAAATLNVDGGDLTMGVGRAVVLDNSGAVADAPLQFAGDPDTGLLWDSANNFRATANGGTVHSWSAAASVALGGFTAANGVIIQAGNNLVFGGSGYIEMNEMAAPAAPAADKVRIYGVVDGGSKTDFAAIFQTGAAQVFAQEP